MAAPLEAFDYHVREFTTFIQQGTPTGPRCARGHLARVTGRSLGDPGPEGPVRGRGQS
jgi:hypothetical protein